jgi:hypothetical protein
MARQKFDGIIEAVRYTPAGEISLARAYERRSTAFGDCVLLTRPQLLEKLHNKRRFATGRRVQYMAGTFEVSGTVHLLGKEGQEIIATRVDADADELKDIPLF